jgi:hypothetical protein
LNDAVCVRSGEVRPEQLLIDVAELIWEPPAGDSNRSADAP